MRKRDLGFNMSTVGLGDSEAIEDLMENVDSVLRRSASKSVKEHRPLRTIGIIARKAFTPPLPCGKKK